MANKPTRIPHITIREWVGFNMYNGDLFTVPRIWRLLNAVHRRRIHGAVDVFDRGTYEGAWLIFEGEDDER